MEVKQTFTKSSEVLETTLIKSNAVFTFEKCPDKQITSKKIEIVEFDGANWWIELAPWKKPSSSSYLTRAVVMCLDLDLKNALIAVNSASYDDAGNINRKFFVKFQVALKHPTSVINKQELKFELDLKECRFVKELMVVYNDPNELVSSGDYVKIKEKLNEEFDMQFDCKVEIISEIAGYEGQVVEKLGVSPVQASMHKLLENGKFSDFEFIVSGKRFKVHKNILSLASPVFDTMFDCDLKEKKQQFSKTNDDPKVFQCLLDFIYSGKLPKNLPQIALSLYEMAHLYQIEQLMEHCMGHILAKRIDAKNALELYQFARSYNVQLLFDRAWDFIRIEMLKIFKPIKREPFTIEEIQEYMSVTETYEVGISKFFKGEEVEDGDTTSFSSSLDCTAGGDTKSDVKK